jgi:hypothetical protein
MGARMRERAEGFDKAVVHYQPSAHHRATKQSTESQVCLFGAPCVGDPGGKQGRFRCSTITGTAWPAMRLLVPAPGSGSPPSKRRYADPPIEEGCLRAVCANAVGWYGGVAAYENEWMWSVYGRQVDRRKPWSAASGIMLGRRGGAGRNEQHPRDRRAHQSPRGRRKQHQWRILMSNMLCPQACDAGARMDWLMRR